MSAFRFGLLGFRVVPRVASPASRSVRWASSPPFRFAGNSGQGMKRLSLMREVSENIEWNLVSLGTRVVPGSDRSSGLVPRASP